jgi:glycosyltransferase involved in cell wall biosynthesis
VGQQSSSDWLAWAHCLVQPSFFEGMSNALLEAMAAGLACVAYDIPPNREALADGTAGELVPVGRIDELGEAMSRLATTSGTAARIGAAAHARAAAWYDVNTIAARVCSAYGSVMKGTAFRAANPTRAAIAQ